MPNESAAAAAKVAAWSADIYAKRDIGSAETLFGPLARGCVTVLSGPRGVGKSWLALALAHAAARGGTLGPWRTRRGHRAVFIDATGSEAVLSARLRALAPKPPPSLVIVPGDAQAGGLPDLSSERGRTALDELVADAELVVVDGVSALARKGRGVGARWAALEDWLRGLRRRNMAVLLVAAKAPPMLADLADTVLKVETPVDGVADADLRLQVKRLSSRPRFEPERFELRLTLRKDGAAWTWLDDIDHRAIIAYRLDRADYSSREIARLLNVSPATAWRLVARGERLPARLRDGVDLEVPEVTGPQNARAIARLLRASLLPREKEGPARLSAREDEGPAMPALGADAGRQGAPHEELSCPGLTGASRSHRCVAKGLDRRVKPGDDSVLGLLELPRGRGSSDALQTQTHETGEAVKQSEANARSVGG